MKKTIASVFVGLACAANSAVVKAEDLLQMYQQALTNDPVVLKASAQYMASQEIIIQARSALLPQLSAFGSYTDASRESVSVIAGSVIDTDIENTSYGANLSMEVYHHDTWLNFDNAKKIAHQADIAYQIAKQDLIIRVTDAYFNLLAAKDDLVFAESQRTAIERQLEQTKQRFSVGLTAVTDVYEAQAQYDDSVTQVIVAQNNIYNAEEALRVITNLYPRNISTLNTDRFSASNPSPDNVNDWQQTAEAKSLDLIVTKISMDIAKEDINIAKAGHLPTLDLIGNYTTSDDEFDVTGLPKVNEPSLDSHSITLQVSVPIYAGGAISSQVRQAQHNYVAASQDMEFAYRNVVQNTRNAYNTVLAAVSALKALKQSTLSAEKALEATEAGFEVGTRTIVDVLDSTRNLYNAKRNLSSTRYSYIRSILALKRAGGTLSEKDVTDINTGLNAT